MDEWEHDDADDNKHDERVRKLLNDVAMRVNDIVNEVTRWRETRRIRRKLHKYAIEMRYRVDLWEANLYRIRDMFESAYFHRRVDPRYVAKLANKALTTIDKIMHEIADAIYAIAERFMAIRNTVEEALREVEGAPAILRGQVAELKKQLDRVEELMARALASGKKPQLVIEVKNNIMGIKSHMLEVVYGAEAYYQGRQLAEACHQGRQLKPLHAKLCRLYRTVDRAVDGAAMALNYLHSLYRRLEELSTELERMRDIEAYIREKEAREEYKR